MKYVEGRALDGIVADQGALPIAVVLLVLRAATDALTYAHEHGIIHRDIKGGNILIDREGRVIVTDFGVARAIENASMTTTGSVIGTPYFMSPEQCAGKVARPQSDQYSLGVVAFQMLTGAVPFQADTLAAIMHHHFFTPVPDVTVARQDAPPELIAVLNRVLSKDPERRYATTRDMRAAVAAVPLSDADRADGEAMLRTLAQGAAVPTVRTEALPPLADTMTVVAAHDAFMRSADRVRRVRQRIGSTSILVAACVVALWIWLRPVGGSTRPTTDDASARSAAVPLAPSPGATAPAGGGAGGRSAAGAATHAGGVAGSAGAADTGVGVPTGGRASPLRRHSPAPPPAPTQTPPAALNAAPVDTVVPTGKLRVRALPSGADIAVDGQVVGEGAIFDLDVPAGSRRLRIAAPGYVDFDTTFVVVAGQTTQLSRITLKGSDEH
jgi:Protein kinase domain/PEGA domain